MTLTTEPLWLSATDLASRLGVTPRTLAYWRQRDEGPKYAPMGRVVRYHADDVLEWENAQRNAA